MGRPPQASRRGKRAPAAWSLRASWFEGANGRRVVTVLAVGYALLFTALCAIKYRYYLYRDFDLAIFVQAMHGMLHGSWYSSIRGMPWLGDHSSLILVPLAPLFLVAPHPLTLLAVQSAALALGAIPVWQLARRELPGGPLPLACAALYLLHPAVGYLDLFEFHPETLAVPLLLWAVLEVRAGRTGRAAIAAGLALLAREDVALPVLVLAMVAAVARPRRPQAAALLAALALGSLALSFGILKPMLLSGEAEYGRMYARWGDSAPAILRGLATHPLEALTALVATPGSAADTALKQEFWRAMFLPVGALSLFAPLVLLPALPIFAEHLLSGRSHQHTIVFQYAALSLPFVVSSAVIGARFAASRLPARALAGGLVAVGVISQLLWGPLLEARPWQHATRNEPLLPDSFERTMRPYRDRMLARVPKSGAVVAGFEFLPALAMRDSVHSLHHVLSGHYTYSERPYPPPHGVRAILGDFSSQIPNLDFGSGARLRAVAAERGLAAADAAGGTLLLLQGARDSLELWKVGAPWTRDSLELVADQQLELFGAERRDSIVPAGGVLAIASTWKRIAPANRRYLAQAWLTRDGRIVFYGRARALGYGIFPPNDWPDGVPVRETYHLLIPDDLPPGTYRPFFNLIAVDANGVQTLPEITIAGRRAVASGVALDEVTVTAPRK